MMASEKPGRRRRRMDATCNFKRIEKKYLLSEAQYDALFEKIGAHLRPDEYGRSTVLSLYLDTPDFRIIRSSVEAVDYLPGDHGRS